MDFVDNSLSCQRILINFFRAGCLTGYNPFDFRADRDHDLIP